MLIPLTLCLALCAQLDGGAALHPADAQAYFEVPSIPAARAAYAQTAAGRMLSDAAVARAIGEEDEGGEGLDIVALLDSIRGIASIAGIEFPPAANLIGLPLERITFSVSPPPNALAVEPGGQATSEPIDLDALRIQVALEFNDASAVAAALEMLTAWLPLATVIGDGARLIILSHTDMADACRERLAGDAPSLSGHPDLERGQEHMRAATGVVLLEGFSNMPADLNAYFDLQGGELTRGLLEGLLGVNLMMFTSGGHWRIQLRDGLFVTEGFVSADAASEMGGVLGSAALAGPALQLVDPEALIGWVTSLDKHQLAQLLISALPGDQETALARFTQEFGFDPVASLIDPLGDELAVCMPPLASLLAAPDVRCIVALADSKRFLAGIEALADKSAVIAGDTFSIKRSSYRKVPIYTVTIEDGPGDFGAFPLNPWDLLRPTIAVMSDRVLFTTNPRYAKNEVRRIIKGQDDAPQLNPRLPKGGLPEGALEVGFADWVAFFGKAYSSVRALAPLLSSFGIDLPIDVSGLPEADAFTRFFAPSLSYKQRVDGGFLHYAESSTGPEFPLAVGLAGSLIESSVSDIFGSSDDEAQDSPPASVLDPEPQALDEAKAASELEAQARVKSTSTNLANLATALMVYKLDQSRYPADLATLTGATSSYPKGFLGRESLPVDGWGRGYRYKPTADGYHLWSVGPDGIDQKGAGDDLMVD